MTAWKFVVICSPVSCGLAALSSCRSSLSAFRSCHKCGNRKKYKAFCCEFKTTVLLRSFIDFGQIFSCVQAMLRFVVFSHNITLVSPIVIHCSLSQYYGFPTSRYNLVWRKKIWPIVTMQSTESDHHWISNNHLGDMQQNIANVRNIFWTHETTYEN